MKSILGILCAVLIAGCNSEVSDLSADIELLQDENYQLEQQIENLIELKKKAEQQADKEKKRADELAEAGDKALLLGEEIGSGSQNIIGKVTLTKEQVREALHILEQRKEFLQLKGKFTDIADKK